MKPPTSSDRQPTSEWQPTPKVFQDIRSGYEAEHKYLKKQRDWAEKLAHDHYEIPKNDAPSLAKRALDAAIKNLRHTSDPKPNLLKRMIQDQAIVYLFQKKLYLFQKVKKNNGKGDRDIVERYKTVAKNYTRRHMGLLFQNSLSVDQERVCDDTIADFFVQIQSPKFTLNSSLPTYLISILKHKIYSSNRSNSPKKTISDAEPKELKIPVEAFDYFLHTHQVIAKNLSQMQNDCLQIILRHYSIDPERVDAASEQTAVNQALSMTEFMERFSIGMTQPALHKTLISIANELGIDPRQASRKHLTCLDQLVLNVANELFAKPTMPLPNSIKAVLLTRIDEARHRRQVAKSKK